MKVAFCADVHVGNHRRFGGDMYAGLNERCRLVVDTLRRALAIAHREQCDVFCVLGDLFDTSNPSPQMVTAVQSAFQEDDDARGHSSLTMTKLVLKGNHDEVSNQEGDHALGPLAPLNGMHVFSRPENVHIGGGVHVLAVPFGTGRAEDWLPGVITKLEKDEVAHEAKLLLIHLGIADDDTPPWLHGSHDAVPVSLLQELCEQHKIDAVFAGNWHNHKQWGNIVQVGALCPTGFDNPGLDDYGRMAIWDNGKIKTLPVPGPRFLKVSSSKELLDDARFVLARNALGDTIAAPTKYYIQLNTTVEKQADEEANIYKLFEPPITDPPIPHRLGGLDVVLDAAVDNAAARTAAQGARSAVTLESSLAAYVEAMPLPEGVNRKAVLNRAKGYLGGA